jgi:hypothetical protein
MVCSAMTKIIGDVFTAIDTINECNSMDIRELANQLEIFYSTKIPDIVCENWKFTGLQNKEFILNKPWEDTDFVNSLTM